MATVTGSLRKNSITLDDIQTTDLTVTGSLTINGTSTTLNSTNTTVTDSIIELNSGLTGANTKDIGFIFERGSTGNNAGFVWDESADRFTVFTTTDTAASDTVNTSSVANFQAGSFYGNGANLTSLNATNISSGTLANARLPDLTVSDFAGSAIQTGSESFSDSDTILMTAAAVQDKILSYGYTTGNQTITLSGDVSGSGTTSISVTVADDSHNHVISNVDGLQTALDAKASLSGATFTGDIATTGITVDSRLVIDGASIYDNSTNGNNKGFRIGGSGLVPLNGSGTDTTNLVDIGTTIYRFKNLYLAGNAYATTFHGFATTAGNSPVYATGSSATHYITFAATNGGGSNDGTGSQARLSDGGLTYIPSTNTLGVGGNITVSGTVDGRDVAADGTKLDTIATNADVTPSWVPSSDPNYLTGNQTITLSGDVSGSGTTSINVTVADDSHNHVISNVDGLQTALDAKLPLAGGNVTGAINLTSTTSTSPAITFNTSSGTDTGVDMAIRAEGEGLNFYEPEDTNKIHMRIVDDTGVNAVFGVRTGTGDGTLRIDGSGNLSNIGAITSSGTLTLSADTSDVLNFSANSTNDARGIAFNNRSALTADYNDTWLRLNANSEFSNGTYTPTTLRVDGAIYANGGIYQGVTQILDAAANLTNINNIYASGYRIGSTTVIDSSRNLTNIGTISSGAISSTGNLDVDGIIDNTRNNGNVSAPNNSDHTAGTRIKFYDGGASDWYAMGIESQTLWFHSANEFKWYEDANLRMTLDGANLTVTGTINSGAITSTGINNASAELIDLDDSIYLILKDPQGSAGLYIGGTGDTNNYYDSNSHIFRAKTGGTSRAVINSSGVDAKSGGFLINGTEVISSSRNLTNIGTISSGAITSSGQISGTTLKVENGTYDGFFGSASFSWAGSTTYPTLYSSHADRWVMIANPHIPYLKNGVNGFTGTTRGASIRMASQPSASTSWDVGVSNVTEDLFRIGRASVNALEINSSLNATFAGLADFDSGITVSVGGSDRLSITGGDVNVVGATDLQIAGTSRRLSFTAGTGTVRTTTANSLILQTNSTTALTLDTSQNATFAGTISATTVNTGQGATEVYLMNQNVRSSDSPTFADLTVTGNLNITGDINSYNVTDLDVTDKTITVGAGQTEANSGGSGLIVDGSGASLLWDESDNYWAMNKSLAFDDTPTTTNQGLGIKWTGFDKEGTTDSTDSASIVHTVNTGGHSGSVLLIESQNDANDGIAFTTNASSYLKHNSSNILTAANAFGQLGITSTAAELNVLDGYTGSVTELNYLDTLHATGVTSTEFDYLDGVTSNIQAQLDAKLASSSYTAADVLAKIKTVDGPGSGLDADTLDGHQLTTASTASTVVERDSAGDINCRLLRSEYDTTNSSIGYIMTQVDTATNNYVRPSTPAQLRSALNVENGATADQTQSDINALGITQVGTITSGTWNGSVIASAYLDSDTAHLSGTQTFTGAKTFSAGINLNNSNITNVNTIQIGDPGPNEGVSWSNIKIYESPDDLTTNTAGNFQVVYGSTRRFTVNSTGADVNGALTATTKSFDIEHPTKEGMRLHHGVLEGPEHAVYIRGKSNSYIIELPDYWEGLVHEDTITVQLTPIGGQNDMWIENIEDNKVYINCEREMKQYFYFIQAERKDVERFEVEYESDL